MKEATGELNMTVITVAIVAGVLVLFTVVILPIIQKNVEHSSKCAGAYACSECANGSMTCTAQNENGNEENVTCSCTEEN